MSLEEKYAILLGAMRQLYLRSCNLIDGVDCASCYAKDVLTEIDENPLKLREPI